MINAVATTILLLYIQTLADLADVAAQTTSWPPGEPGRLRDPSPMLHAAAALLLLVVAATLAIYKPRGRTRHGQRRQQQRRAPPRSLQRSPSTN